MPIFDKVLIANRGEVAARIARTCRRLGMKTVAVASEVDVDGYHSRCADEVVAVGPARVSDSYLNIEAIVAAAAQSGAAAVHPGYGLLSEDAGFAAAVRAAGLVFVGPSENALEQLGDKIRARGLARAQGLVPPPGTSEPLTDDLAKVASDADDIGYPLLIKAAAGGGGIGMQLVEAKDELEKALATCRARAQAAFGDSRVYMEKYLRRPRHIEIQIAADSQGRVVALGDRECSVQRRHQKVIEEAPAAAKFMTARKRQEVYRHACDLIASVGYVGVATVEFIADATVEDPELYFLEVNARLQVEHPVTELVTGLDLVELQLRVAAGEALPAAVTAGPVVQRGYAVEARLYAEDPDKKFMPQPGTLERLSFPEGAGLRVDTGYEQGDSVTPYYDPLIAKVIVYGATRNEAIQRLREVLAKTEVSLVGAKGPRKTNLEFLLRVLGSQAFVSGDYDTHLVGDLLT